MQNISSQLCESLIILSVSFRIQCFWPVMLQQGGWAFISLEASVRACVYVWVCLFNAWRCMGSEATEKSNQVEDCSPWEGDWGMVQETANEATSGASEQFLFIMRLFGSLSNTRYRRKLVTTQSLILTKKQFPINNYTFQHTLCQCISVPFWCQTFIIAPVF